MIVVPSSVTPSGRMALAEALKGQTLVSNLHFHQEYKDCGTS